MARSNDKRKNVNSTTIKAKKGNKRYVATPDEGKVKVRARRTAKGQSTLVGIYVVDSKVWQNLNKDYDLPEDIKKSVEKLYA